MDLPFESFPYSQCVWAHVIRQLRQDPDSDIVFTNQVSRHVIDMTDFDYTKVTYLIIGTGVSELHAIGDHTGYLQKTIDNFKKFLPNLQNIYIFHTTVYFDTDLLVSDCNITSINFPYFLLRSTLTDLSQFNQWDVGDKKAICLVGDIRNRPHKFPLLYKFHQCGQLDKLNYSLMNNHYDPDYFTYNHVGSVVRNLNDCFDNNLDIESFEMLYNKLKRTLPNDENFKNRIYHGLSTYTHIYPEQWNEASCNIVLETTFLDIANLLCERVPKNYTQKGFFSEKIWKPILSGKPFTTISFNDVLYDDLEQMGFRTFLNYTNHPEKLQLPNNLLDSSKVLKKHIEVCYDRTMSFLDSVETQRDSILEDVKFNMNRWRELSQQAWDNVYQQCPPAMSMTKDEFCELFNHPVNVGLLSQWFNKG